MRIINNYYYLLDYHYYFLLCCSNNLFHRNSKKYNNDEYNLIIVSNRIEIIIKALNNIIRNPFGQSITNDLNSENFVIYNVTVNNHDLKFVKSSITNRWWVTIENINLVQMEKSYIPCVEDDYLLSKNSILSDRILLRIKNKIS